MITVKDLRTSAIIFKCKNVDLNKALIKNKNNLQHADFHDLTFKNISLCDINFSHANFCNTKIINCEFTHCDFTEVNMCQAIINDVAFNYSNINGIYLKYTKFIQLYTSYTDIIYAGTDSRGHDFVATKNTDGIFTVFAGCRRFTGMKNALEYNYAHGLNYPKNFLQYKEAILKIKYLINVAKNRKWKMEIKK